MLLVEKAGIEVAVVPKDITGAVQNGQYISMKGFEHLTIIIVQGAWAGGTPAVTLGQATAVAGTGAKALGFTKYWQKAGLTASQFASTDVVSNTFNLPNTANTVTAIEVPSDTLDVTNGFDCVRVSVASPGANADLLSIIYVLSSPRRGNAVMADAKID